MAKEGKFSPRAMMEKAIEVMRECVDERRDDKKPPPRVGAVLVKLSAGPLGTAYRGELREGDHAEYTLLERKNRDQRLDGSVLFSTLEPCAPGARNHPKLSCAERIVLARIKEVWVGIEDPDPTVDRKGIKYLQDNGVIVHMFDHDLQQVIRDFNREFILGALERAAMEEVRAPITLSKFEHSFADAHVDDFSREALETYRASAGIEHEVGSPGFNRRLSLQGLINDEDGKLSPTGFGLLLFGREPRTVMPQAGILATIHYSDSTEETMDFDGPMVFIPNDLEEWLRDKLPSVLDRTRMQHESVPALPFELVREAVVNALVHRDYDVAGAKIQFVVTPDKISVKSPGGPLPPITLQQLQEFNAPMLSRNPELQYVFARMSFANERGLGMKSLRSIPEKYGLPLPKFSYDAPYLELSLFRNAEGVASALPPSVLQELSDSEREGWQWLSRKESISSSEYSDAMALAKRTVSKHLKHFKELGLVEQIGSGPSTRYKVKR